MKFTVAALVAVLAPVAQAFVSPQQLHAMKKHMKVVTPPPPTVVTFNPSTRRQMYNLPPGGGGGGGNKNDFQGILTGVGTIAAIGLFFASPLGSIFFAITNSLFLLALLVPVLAYVGFQGWQAFYTMEGPCPSCGAPCRVLKENEEMTPSFCFNCGAVLQTRGDTIVVAQDSPVVDQDGSSFGGGGSDMGSIFDMLMNNQDAVSSSISDEYTTTTTTTSSSSSTSDKASKFKREQTIIDVEIEDD